MATKLIYVLEYDIVDSRRHNATLGASFHPFLNAMTARVREGLRDLAPFDGAPALGDSATWFFAEPSQAVRAGIRLVDNFPPWSQQETNHALTIHIRAVAYETSWTSGQSANQYDLTRAVGKTFVDGHKVPDDALAVQDKVLEAARRAESGDALFEEKRWPPNHCQPNIQGIGRVNTRLRPGRIRVGQRKVEGAMIAPFPQPLAHGEIQGKIDEGARIGDDDFILSGFELLNRERLAEGREPLYNGRCFRIARGVYSQSGLTYIPVAEIPFATHEVWRRAQDPKLREYVVDKLSKLPATNDVSVLGPWYPVPLGVEVVITTSDRPPRLLLIKRSRHVHLSAGHWDTSFSGYVNRNDLSSRVGSEFVDFWKSAHREAENELSGYTLEVRSLRFFGVHLDIETGAVNLIGHARVQERHDELERYLRPLQASSKRLPVEPELSESSFAWVELSPQAIAGFCQEQRCSFGGRREQETALISQAAATVLYTLRSSGFSDREIEASLEDVCQPNYE